MPPFLQLTMIARLNKLFTVLVVVGLALYIVLLNQGTSTLQLAQDVSFTANSGIMFIAVFCVGVLSAALVAAIFGVKTYLRERRYKHQARQRHVFYDGMLSARGLAASGEWERARVEWEALLRKDPTDIIARLELAESLAGAGQTKEALKIVDGARSVAPQNIEVLFRAAELNLTVGNKTAAIDNLALILYHQPNRKAAEMARDLSEDLGRIDDALEYHRQAERLIGQSVESSKHLERLSYKKLLEENGADLGLLREKLQQFVRRHTDFAPGLKKLSELEEQLGNYDAAAQLLMRSGKTIDRAGSAKRAADLWLRHGMPDQALSALRSVAKETKGAERLSAELHLIRLYLAIHMYQDAERLLDGFQTLAKNEGVEIDQDLSQELLVLKGLCLGSLGKHQESAEVWKRLRDQDYRLKEAADWGPTTQNGDAPAARLSTP